MKPPHPGDQLPGLPDSLVGISDLPPQHYPWNEQDQESQVNSHTHYLPPHPMQLAPNTPGASERGCSDPHDLSVTGFPSSPPVQFQGGNFLIDHQHSLETSTMRSGRWIWHSCTTPSQNLLPPIASLDFGPSFPNSWNTDDHQLTPLSHQPSSMSPPSLTNDNSPSLPAVVGRVSHIHEQHLPRQVSNDSLEAPPEQNVNSEQEIDHFSPLCEFSRPCHMSPSPDGVHFRKIVSHLFGRNKASTKLFPDSVWVYYCRKHYQRARYRAEQWPFNQCELLFQSLDRMESWGYVLNFELRLRRREALRNDGQGEKPTPTGLLRNGRRHPTAITAPVPEWLRREVGTNKSFAEIREIVKRIRSYLTRLQEEEDSKKQQQSKQNGTVSFSKDEKKVAHNAAGRERNSLVRFPDIEILPTFHPDVMEDARRRAAEKKRGVKADPKGDGEEQQNAGVGDDCFDDEEEEYGVGASRRKNCLRLKVGSRVSSRGAVKKPNKKKK